MSGGLLQIVAVGAQDIYLTGNPQITYFKIIYRRHTNFAVESIEQFFSGPFGFGKQGVADISRSGDLITQIILKVVLPQVVFNGSFDERAHAQFAWVKHIGHAILDESELEIGGSKIVTQYGDWLRIWQELSQASGHKQGLCKMLGDVPELTSISTLPMEDTSSDVLKRSYPLYIPLQFYFCRNNGLALPLIALQYHQVKLKIKLRPIEQLAIYNDSSIGTVKQLKLDHASLFINYIYLDVDERKRFAQHSHEYLIEQIQNTDEAITNNSAKCKLNFNHPVKAIYWITKLGNYKGGKFMSYDPNNWELARENAAKMLLLSQFDLDQYGLFADDMDNTGTSQYVPINPLDPNVESNFVLDNSAVAEYFSKGNNIRELRRDIPLMQRKSNGVDLRDKIDGIIRINMNMDDSDSLYPTVEKITRNDLTLCDLSVIVDKYIDNRNNFIKKSDLTVWQHHNYGMLIDGSVNPVNTAELQLNGQSRQSKREGSWYDTVAPYLHHTNSPVSGLNMLSFALNPEEHQPSCTCNFSRLDSPQLSLTFGAPDASSSDYTDIFTNANNQVLIFCINYNVYRIISGMGGLAYSN